MFISISRWTVNLFKKSYQDGLTTEDLCVPLASDESESVANDLER